jgi:hypothetical protein
MKDDSFIEIIPLGDEPTPAEALSDAQNASLDYVLIIGRKGNGWYFGTSDPDPVKAVLAAQNFCNFMTE